MRRPRELHRRFWQLRAALQWWQPGAVMQGMSVEGAVFQSAVAEVPTPQMWQPMAALQWWQLLGLHCRGRQPTVARDGMAAEGCAAEEAAGGCTAEVESRCV